MSTTERKKADPRAQDCNPVDDVETGSLPLVIIMFLFFLGTAVVGVFVFILGIDDPATPTLLAKAAKCGTLSHQKYDNQYEDCDTATFTAVEIAALQALRGDLTAIPAGYSTYGCVDTAGANTTCADAAACKAAIPHYWAPGANCEYFAGASCVSPAFPAHPSALFSFPADGPSCIDPCTHGAPRHLCTRGASSTFKRNDCGAQLAITESSSLPSPAHLRSSSPPSWQSWSSTPRRVSSP